MFRNGGALLVNSVPFVDNVHQPEQLSLNVWLLGLGAPELRDRQYRRVEDG